MKINNDFCTSKRIAFKNANVIERFPVAVSMQPYSQNNKQEKAVLKKPMRVDKFDKYSEVSRNEILALGLSLAAAGIVILFGLAEIFKRPGLS